MFKSLKSVFIAVAVVCFCASASAQAKDPPAADPQTSVNGSTTQTTTAQTAMPDASSAMPPQAPLKLASIRIRIDAASLPDGNDTAAFKKIDAVRAKRDKSLEDMTATTFQGKLSKHEMLPIANAAQDVLKVCGMGTDYIQYRLRKNSDSLFNWGLFTSFLGLGMVSSIANTTTNNIPHKNVNAIACLYFNFGSMVNAPAIWFHMDLIR